MSTPYHYPPDLFELLIDAISKLYKFKKQVFGFFRGAGVPRHYFRDIEQRWQQNPQGISKADIAREILQHLNEDASDRALEARRNVIVRVIATEDYNTCWENDRLPAQGLVEQIRKRVDKHDAFARMAQERERERQRRSAAEAAKREEEGRRQDDLERVRTGINALFGEKNPQCRGRQLEKLMNQLFKAAGIGLLESFTVSDDTGVIEQIDGAVEIDGHIYLVEVKWLQKAFPVSDARQHLSRLRRRSGARGILISYSQFSRAAIQECKNALVDNVVILVDLEEIILSLERQQSIVNLLRAKAEAAITHKNPCARDIKN